MSLMSFLTMLLNRIWSLRTKPTVATATSRKTHACTRQWIACAVLSSAPSTVALQVATNLNISERDFSVSEVAADRACSSSSFISSFPIPFPVSSMAAWVRSFSASRSLFAHTSLNSAYSWRMARVPGNLSRSEANWPSAATNVSSNSFRSRTISSAVAAGSSPASSLFLLSLRKTFQKCDMCVIAPSVEECAAFMPSSSFVFTVVPGRDASAASLAERRATL
mmetsp:Transcript_25705/g.60983  ORF Transcript_25705/g.60983 Transcript_25705/m.60983 type:complete len:223 (+) Transcript_25705:775-1443(+)